MLLLIRKKIRSLLRINETNKYKYECIKICLIYSALGSLWIYFSDRIVNKLIGDSAIRMYLSIYKGWFYVIITAVTLYFLINRLVKKVDLAEAKLNESNDELAASNEELQAYVQQLTASEEELRSQYDQIIESEKKLSISEGKNRAIVKAIPDLLFIIDSKGDFIDCKANDESLLLMPKEAFIGKNLLEVMPKEIYHIAFEKLQVVLKLGTVEKFEYRLDISGKKFSFELRMVKNNEKEVLAIARNVTVERQKELELKISEERYRTLINEMKQGIALYGGSSDDENITDYVLLDANESHERLMEKKTKDILGKTAYECFPTLEKEIFDKLNIVVKTGETQYYEHYFKDINKYYEIVAYRPKKLQAAIIVNDITARKKAEEELRTSEYNFRNIFENSSDAILLTEGNGFVDCNLAALELLGYDSKEALLGKSAKEFSEEKQPDGELSVEKAHEMYKHTIQDGKCKFEWWIKRVDGSLVPVEIMLTTILLNGRKVYHSLLRDISDRKQMEEKLEFLSYHDQLTGLYNRRFFEEELIRQDIEAGLPLTLIMADVNGLKLVNDSFGHATGDELLKKVAEVMKNGFRKNDIISRLGGDEFVAILPNTNLIEAEQIVKDIKALASKEKVSTVDVSISFGYQVKTNEDENIQDVLKKAEDYMYKKKLLEGPSMRGKTIKAIVSTLHEKNRREEEHSLRVSRLCEKMGTVLGLPEDEIKELKTVGLLHDIGKIAIEENILNKPGKLTDEEWEEIKKHPEIGYRILSTVNELSEMAEYVLAHHERFDGRGYPKGLKGLQIPMKSRIITIADSYDAMVSERSYRNALPEEVAIAELRKNAGSQFDAELTKIFIEKVLNKKF